MKVASEKEFVVVSAVPGLSKVVGYIGNRIDGYVPVAFPVGTIVNNVSKYPFELKKFWADVEGVQHVFWKDTLKPAPAKKKVKETA